jgi:hypothetical protein
MPHDQYGPVISEAALHNSGAMSLPIHPDPLPDALFLALGLKDTGAIRKAACSSGFAFRWQWRSRRRRKPHSCSRCRTRSRPHSIPKWVYVKCRTTVVVYRLA